jgi:hypothetical protein
MRKKAESFLIHEGNKPAIRQIIKRIMDYLTTSSNISAAIDDFFTESRQTICDSSVEAIIRRFFSCLNKKSRAVNSIASWEQILRFVEQG